MVDDVPVRPHIGVGAGIHVRSGAGVLVEMTGGLDRQSRHTGHRNGHISRSGRTIPSAGADGVAAVLDHRNRDDRRSAAGAAGVIPTAEQRAVIRRTLARLGPAVNRHHAVHGNVTHANRQDATARRDVVVPQVPCQRL